jgi:hypothetical protein
VAIRVAIGAIGSSGCTGQVIHISYNEKIGQALASKVVSIEWVFIGILFIESGLRRMGLRWNSLHRMGLRRNSLRQSCLRRKWSSSKLKVVFVEWVFVRILFIKWIFVGILFVEMVFVGILFVELIVVEMVFRLLVSP